MIDDIIYENEIYDIYKVIHDADTDNEYEVVSIFALIMYADMYVCSSFAHMLILSLEYNGNLFAYAYMLTCFHLWILHIYVIVY